MAVNKVVYGNTTLIDLTSDTVAADKILKGKTAHDKSGTFITGTMPNRGAVSQSLNAGGSYTIPAGYHNGSGKVTANSLASQTQGTATASDIAKGITAWVNGSKLTGTKEDATTTITVTYNSTFYNKTMTCTKGTKTYTKTTTSSGSTTFNVNEEGTWTITCNGVSRTVNVVLSYSTQMAITKTITIHGAKEDYITYTDATGSKVCQFASGATSKSVSITFIPPSATITFTSTVAKNPNNLIQNYSKTVTVTNATTEIYVMPEHTLYWFGYMNSNLCEEISTANGWSGNGMSGTPPTYNTNNFLMPQTSGGTVVSGIGTKRAISGTLKAIVHSVGGIGGQMGGLAAKTALAGPNPAVSPTNTSDQVITVVLSSKVAIIWSFATNSGIVSAFWYE